MIVAGRLLGWLVTASTVIGAAGVVLMMLQIVVDVLLKNLFQTSIPATTIVVAHYYMVMIAFLPMALAEKLNAHITVEVLVQHFSTRVRSWMAAVTWLVSAIVTGAVAMRLWTEAVKKFQVGAFLIEQNVPIVIWPSYFVLPIGFGLFSLVLLYRFIRAVTGTASGLGETPMDAHDERPEMGVD